MLGSLAASKAIKLAALCVCPVGAAVVTTQVPQVRSAVHKMTAPRHVPARRLAPRIAAVPKAAAQTAIAAPCPTAVPVVLQGGEALTFAIPVLSENPFSQPGSPGGPTRSVPPGIGTIAEFPSAPAFEPNLPAVPEPGTWVQFGLGFALLGGIIRSPRLRAKMVASGEAQAS